jgi:hypothetical protein
LAGLLPGSGVIAVKTIRRGGVSRVCATTGLLTKNVEMDVNTSFLDIMSEVKKDWEDVSAGIDNFF